MEVKMHDVQDILRAAASASCPKEKVQEVIAWIETMTFREKTIVKKLYGLDGEDKRSLDEIAQGFEVTRKRIKMIHDKAVRKLRSSHELRLEYWRKGRAVPPEEDFRRIKSFIND